MRRVIWETDGMEITNQRRSIGPAYRLTLCANYVPKIDLSGEYNRDENDEWRDVRRFYTENRQAIL